MILYNVYNAVFSNGNHVMGRVLASSVVEHGFQLQSGLANGNHVMGRVLASSVVEHGYQ